jgi:hypothetical protein
MIRIGVMTEDSPSVAGFNPELMTIFLLSRDAKELERFEDLLAELGPDPDAAERQLAVSINQGTRKTRMVGRTRHAVKLGRSLDKKDTIGFLEAEATLGVNGQLIDLQFFYRDGPSEEPHRSSHVRLTVNNGVPVEAMAHRIAGEALPPLMAKAEVVGPSGEVGETKGE